MNWLKRLLRFRLTEIEFAALWGLPVKWFRHRKLADEAEEADRMAYLKRRV